MLILASTTDKIRLLTGTAGSIMVHASWMDNIAGAISPGRTNTPEITTPTTTDIVPPPSTAGTHRAVKTLHIHNNSATAFMPMSVFHTDGTNSVYLYSVTLAPKDTLQYIDEVGFRVVTYGGEEVMGPRTLLKKIVPAGNVHFIDIGPDVLSNPAYEVFEVEYSLKTPNGSADGGVLGYFSPDNGATFPQIANSIHEVRILGSSGNVPGWNIIQGLMLPGVATLAGFIGNPFWNARGTFKIFQGDPGGTVAGELATVSYIMGQSMGFGYNSNLYATWVPFASGLFGLFWGRITVLRMAHTTAVNFLPVGYVKVYGIR